MPAAARSRLVDRCDQSDRIGPFHDLRSRAFTKPATASEVNVDLANGGTLTGALCFAIGGVMQGYHQQATKTR